MSKIDVVRKAMMDALKAGDKPRKEALSLLLSALKAKFIDKRADLTEDEENAVVYKEIKEAQETIDTTPADRTEVIEECKLRIAVYSEFAPARMDEAAIRQVIAQTLAELGLENPTAKDKGKLMKALMPKLNGKADGALVNKLVGTYLG
ncbi:MAG: GatB/YqeY domain-containing protein [Clostridiales bacterium]|nr:GatB/YqeY domain-containing protein [Clostridiales bacterium]MDO4350906.1 GatB/YqeY domain-containing protein [Eubacteriales bacterium]MDY4009835.1 GatB/YqeY domain-containing protein [Candidatus Limiplasma sp.]